MQAWIEEIIKWMLDVTQFSGYYILLISLPLTIFQSIFTLFPFASIIILHIATFDLYEGLFISWIVGSIGSVICFVLSRYFFYNWFENRFGKHLIRYEKWQRYMDHYGVSVIILLRTVPFVPNNVVSFMAAVSPIRFNAFFLGNAIGMLSHIWMLGIISSSISLTDTKFLWVWYTGYGVFCFSILVLFLLQVKKIREQNFTRNEG